MGKMKKKYESGAATAYIARNQAIKKLQLTIADFRRLCILKGVYPVEPKNKKKVDKGRGSANRTYYYVKDINYIAQEPIINKFREFKVYVKRLKRAKGRREIKNMGRLRANKPFYKLDHIVKERYPTFQDAVRDLDDCLSLVFLFSMLPKSKRVYVERIQLARKLSVEFLQYIILSQSLRKCFISIKGYYFQADIMGEKITWIMPHNLAYHTPEDVDFRIMSTFIEFYSIMLGFVNFKLYHDIGLFYPPKLAQQQIPEDSIATKNTDEEDFNDELLASLNCDFLKITEQMNKQNVDEQQLDDFPVDGANPDAIDRAKIEENNLKKLKSLFKGFKFFINREVPREIFSFVIRCFSGQVSWDKTVAIGSTYQEDDLTITHHIIDRPTIGKTYLNRVYVQPQWVFDCINENMILPVDDYLPGAALPPHLSPFVEIREGDYVPPEKQRLVKLKLGILNENGKEKSENDAEDDDDDDEDSEEEETEGKKESANDKKKNGKNNKQNGKKKESSSEEEEEEEEEEEDDEEDEEEEESDDQEDEDEEIEVNKNQKKNLKNKKTKDEKSPKVNKNQTNGKDVKDEKPKTKMAVTPGKPEVINMEMKLKKEMDEEKRLAELMIPKKHKRLYSKIMYSQKKKRQEVERLKEKRKAYEEKTKNEKKKKQKTK